MNKLRRHEGFMLQLPHPAGGTISLWIHPENPLVLQFYGSRPPAVDGDTVEQMMQEASGSVGLTLRPLRWD